MDLGTAVGSEGRGGRISRRVHREATATATSCTCGVDSVDVNGGELAQQLHLPESGWQTVPSPSTRVFRRRETVWEWHEVVVPPTKCKHTPSLSIRCRQHPNPPVLGHVRGTQSVAERPVLQDAQNDLPKHLLGEPRFPGSHRDSPESVGPPTSRQSYSRRMAGPSHRGGALQCLSLAFWALVRAGPAGPHTCHAASWRESPWPICQ